MSFADFCDIFNECMQNKDQHDELLQSAFAVFDFDKYYFYLTKKRSGYIDSKKIKKVFEKFKDSTTEEEIQSNGRFSFIF